MLITIWRHGEAGSARSDRQRELTSSGASALITGVGQFVRALEARALPQPSEVWCSPWCRTRQTASILQQQGLLPAMDESRLQPGASISAVEDWLNASVDYSDERHILLVSHQPFVSQLIDYLLGDTRVAPLSPGGFACLRAPVVAPAMADCLFWALPPYYGAMQ